VETLKFSRTNLPKRNERGSNTKKGGKTAASTPRHVSTARTT